MLDAALATALLDVLPTGLLLIGAKGEVVHATEPAAQLLGTTVTALQGRALSTVLGGKDVGPEVARVSVTLPEGAPVARVECVLKGLPEAFAPYSRVACLIDPTQIENRRGLRIPPLAELDVARLDPDTGLLNRKNTLQELNAQVSRSRRYGNALSIIYVRVDDVPVEELRKLAQAIKGTLRWVDIVGRWDEDALLVILPETSRDAARQLASKLGAVVGQGNASPDAIAGSAQWSRGEESIDLVARAAAGTGPVEDKDHAIAS